MGLRNDVRELASKSVMISRARDLRFLGVWREGGCVRGRGEGEGGEERGRKGGGGKREEG